MIIKVNKKISDDGTKTGYDFQILPEESKEDVRDFHMFSISIVNDILENKFKLNESGAFSYDLSQFDDKDIESTTLMLHYLHNIILKEKTDLDDQMKDLLK